jgi:thymidylate kinase
LELAEKVTNKDFYSLYNLVIHLKGNLKKSLEMAISSKHEFKDGDEMESRGLSFQEKVSVNFEKYASKFSTVVIDVEGKSMQEVHQKILALIKDKLNL